MNRFALPPARIYAPFYRRLRVGYRRAYVERLAIVQLILWSCFYYSFSAMIPMIAQQTGWAIDHLFYALTMGFVLWAVGSPIAGYWVDRGYGSALLRASIIVGCGLLAVIAVSESSYVVYGCMVLLGIPMAFTLYDPAFSILMRKIDSPDKASDAILRVTFAGALATLLIYPSVTALEPMLSWREMYWILVGMVAVAFAIYPHDMLRERGRKKPHPTAQRERVRIPLKSRVIMPCLLLGFSFGFGAFAHALLVFQLPTYLIDNGSSAGMLGLFGVLQLVGRMMFPLLKNRVLPELVMGVLFALMVVAMALIWGTQASPVFLTIALMMQGIAVGLNTVMRPVVTRRYFDQKIIGTMLGTNAMIGLGLTALCPAVGAFLALTLGFDILFGTVIALELTAIALLAVCYGRYYRQS